MRGSAVSIESLLHHQKVKEYYPSLSKVKRNEQGASKGWTADFINTEANYVFHFIGLDEGVAGANFDDIRPSLIVPDDIDDREDSPVISETRFQTFTRAVLPTKQANTLVFFAQNLISRYSVMYRIYKQHARVLTNRLLTEPIPAVRRLITETRTIGGIIKDIVVSGTPTWHVWDIRRVQEEIDTYGLDAFLRECQHEVELSKEGVILYNYDDAVHVISESEFASVYGSIKALESWTKWTYNDWARTKTSKHANVAGYITVSSQNTRFPGATFMFHPLSFPANTEAEDVAERLLSVLTPYAVGSTTWQQLRSDTLTRANANHYASTFREKTEFERGYLKNIIPQYSRPILRRFNVRGGVISHSEDTIRKIYNDVFGFDFSPANPGKTEAIEEINRAMKIDYTLMHPFRPEQKGFTRWFIVVPDDRTDQNPCYVNGMTVYRPVPANESLQPHELFDYDLLRYQLKNWRRRDPVLSATGEAIDDTLKLDDDFGQSLQMFYMKQLITNTPLTPEEEIEAEMPPELSQENLAQSYGQPRFVELVLRSQAEHRRVELQIEEERERDEQKLRDTFSSGRRVHLSGNRRR